MKLGSLLTASLVCSFIGVVACGQSDEEKAAEAARAAEQAELAAQDQFLQTYCEIMLTCCNQILVKNASDFAGCKAHLKKMDPVTIKDKAARDLCLVQTRAARPNPAFCKDFAHMPTPACPDPSRAKLLGTKKLGEICEKVDDCAPDFTGIVDCAQGICQLRKRGAEGDGPCDTTIDGDVSLPFNQPATDATVFTCYRKDEAPTQCSSVSNTCVVALGEREDCENTTECAKGLFCDQEEKKCFPKFVAKSVCRADDECKGHCKIDDAGGGGDDDDDDSEGPTGFCEDAVGEDEDCTTTGWCEDGLECISGKCTQPGPDARLAATCVP